MDPDRPMVPQSEAAASSISLRSPTTSASLLLLSSCLSLSLSLSQDLDPAILKALGQAGNSRVLRAVNERLVAFIFDGSLQSLSLQLSNPYERLLTYR
jgi:hypothetical protein